MDFSIAHNLIKNKKLIILYDDMEGWDENEIEIPKQSINQLDNDLKELNINFQIISSKGGIDKVINKFNPANTIIFNWIESVNDEPNTYHLIPPFYENSNNVRWDIFPCIVKPCAEHGSDGISRDAVIDNMEQLNVRITEISE